MSVDGRTRHVDVARVDAHGGTSARTLSLIVEPGASYDVGIVPTPRPGCWACGSAACRCAVALERPARRGRPDEHGHGGSGPQRIVAPMPGKIVRVAVTAGRGRPRASDGRGHRSDEDGKRAASRPRRHGRRAPRAGRRARSRPASCWSSSSEVADAPPRALGRSLRRPHDHARDRAARGGDRRLADDRSRAVAARARRAPGVEAAQAGRPHRPAVHPRPARPRPARGFLHRRPGTRRPAVLHRQAPLARPRLVHRVPARARVHDHVGRADRLAHARRTMGRPHQLPEVRAGRRSAAGAAAVHDDAQVPEGVARPVRRTKITRCRGASWRRTSTWTSRTCRSTTATPRSTAASSRSRTICRCGSTSRRSSRSTARSVHLDRIDLATDGAETVASGDVDFAHWPEQLYQREVRACTSSGCARSSARTRSGRSPATATSTGTFRLYKGGHDLSGTFTSQEAGVNGYRVPAALRLAALDAAGVRGVGRRRRTSHGGAAQFAYSIKPLGEPTRPTARFDATVAGADLAAFTDCEQLAGVRFRRRGDRTRPARMAARAVRRAHREAGTSR